MPLYADDDLVPRLCDSAEVLLAKILAFMGSNQSANANTALISGPALGITGLTGGGATNLDGITTVGVDNGRLVYVNDASEGPGVWELTTGTTAENAGSGIVRPDDYSGSNTRNWIRRF